MSAAPTHAFVLNLDAEEELEDPSAQTSTAAVRARIAVLAQRLVDLVAGGIVVEDGVRADGARGLAWCATPSALARLRAAGAVPAATPPFEIVRRVNHRRFSFDLGPTLPGETWATSVDDVRRALAAGGEWLLKAGYGFAGRGRVVLAGPPSDADLARIARLVAGGGAQLEPLVRRRADYAMHGWLAASGELTRGGLTRQRCDERGAWLGTERFDEDDVAVPLWDELDGVARALHDAGYFGPFGIDAFTWEAPGGAVALRRRCEINARYSMGWAIGMGSTRPDLAQ